MLKFGIVMHRTDNSGIPMTGQNSAYIDYFSTMGNVDYINPTSEVVNTNIDFLVLTGGEDVNPERYGEVPSIFCGKPNLYAEWFDTHMLDKYIEAGIKVIGICRGFQTLCVKYGEKLVQHVPIKKSYPRSDMNEKMVINDFGRGYKYGEEKEVAINSIHHQAIYEFDNHELEAMGIEKVEGNIEAMCHKELPIFAVQYHPEEIHCPWFEKMVMRMAKGEPLLPKETFKTLVR